MIVIYTIKKKLEPHCCVRLQSWLQAAEEAPLPPAIGGERAIDGRRQLVRPMATTKALYRREDAEPKFQQKMRAAPVRAGTVPIGMHGSSGTPRQGKGGDGLAAILKGLNLEQIGPSTAPLDIFSSVNVGHDTPRAPRNLGDLVGSEMRDKCVERGRNRGQSA